MQPASQCLDLIRPRAVDPTLRTKTDVGAVNPLDEMDKLLGTYDVGEPPADSGREGELAVRESTGAAPS